MALTIEEVRKIAELARLQLTSEEEELFAKQLGDVVDYIDQLGNFETTPEDAAEASLAEAEDVVGPALAIDDVLANAPEALDRFLVVPRVKSDG
ncbi:MAG: Asp-tRNA(Asn)/Glu-tRNA(Gln) amidotransferase subunit GatC [Acidobacteriota bacterium]